MDPDGKDNEGKTPLMLAAQRGHLEVVKLLLQTEKVDLDGKDSEGKTPLIWACEKGKLEVVELLLKTGKVDPDRKDYGGRTPLMWVCKIESWPEESSVSPDAKNSVGEYI